MPWAPQTSCQHPPVDPDRAAEDVSRLVAHEEGDHVRDLLRPTEAIEGHDALEQRLVGARRELNGRGNRVLKAPGKEPVDRRPCRPYSIASAWESARTPPLEAE